MRDIKIDDFKLTAGGKTLLNETTLKVINKHKYGLVGINGCGKSESLKYIAGLKTQEAASIFLVYQEMPTEEVEKSVFQTVLDANTKRMAAVAKSVQRERSETRAEFAAENNGSYYYNCDSKNDSDCDNEGDSNGGEDDLQEYVRDEATVHKILNGLGFTNKQREQQVSTFSGGWRMRVNIARALYMDPDLLLLDEPTNHLDFDAVVWLINYLTSYKKTVIVVSHDRHFLNSVCTDIIHINNQRLTYYKGSADGAYDSFETMHQQIVSKEWAEWKKIEAKTKDMRNRCFNTTPPTVGKEQLEAFIAENADKQPQDVPRSRCKLIFQQVGKLRTVEPFIRTDNLAFRYPTLTMPKFLFKNISLAIELNTKIAIVAKNGAGKSTFLKILAGKIPIHENYCHMAGLQSLKHHHGNCQTCANTHTRGSVYIKSGTRIGYFDQHCSDVLPLDKTPIEYLDFIAKTAAGPTVLMQGSQVNSVNSVNSVNPENIRKCLGTCGLENEAHAMQIGKLSGGQKSRVAFAAVFVISPHVLLLDEPTNHLDMETIDSLILSIKSFTGGVVLITHNIDLIKKTGCIVLKLENENLFPITLN